MEMSKTAEFYAHLHNLNAAIKYFNKATGVIDESNEDYRIKEVYYSDYKDELYVSFEEKPYEKHVYFD